MRETYFVVVECDWWRRRELNHTVPCIYLHLPALIVLYQHLMTFPKSEEMQIDAAKCTEFGK